VSDTGTLSVGDGARFVVEDVQVLSGYVLHIGNLERGNIKVGDRVKSTYDEVS
jgi:alanyl-tRNA synthetase